MPDRLLNHWEAGDFELVSSEEQLEEVERVLAYEKLKRLIRPEQASQLLNNLRNVAFIVGNLPALTIVSDFADNVILATAVAGGASQLVTGDKGHLLVLREAEGVSIITVKEAIYLLAPNVAG